MSYLSKIVNLFMDTVYPWISSLLLYVLMWAGESKELLLYVVLTVLLDFLFGVRLSFLHNKVSGLTNLKSLKSSGVRSSLSKLGSYLLVVFLTILIDKVLCLDSFAITRGVVAVIISAELWSILSFLIILYPQNKVLSYLRKFLESEVSEKLRKFSSQSSSNFESFNEPSSNSTNESFSESFNDPTGSSVNESTGEFANDSQASSSASEKQ